MKKALIVLVVMLISFGAAAIACTILGVGKDAMVNGSTIITHNDDSTVADFRLWIIPAMDWPEGSMRDIVLNSHNYIDYGNYPNVDIGTKGTLIGQIPQVPHTYAYFHSRYSFMNEKGVAISESTFGIDTSTDYGKEVRKVLYTDSPGIIDCWTAQDIALERAATAREAVRIMGDMVELYGWSTVGGGGESMTVADGDDCWYVEFFGRDLWAAVRIPDDHYTVAANRARIMEIDINDTENVMASPNIFSFAIEQGWYDPASGKPFNLAEVYAPNDNLYATRREWRALDLVAPSLGLSPHDLRFPLSVKPERLLTVHDIFVIKGDYYQGTDYDLTVGPAAGPWGNPIRYANTSRTGTWERSINMHRTCYVHIGETNSAYADPFKGIAWYGYGAPDTAYMVPLWPIMRDLPKFYETGSRYEEFRRDSGWWVSSYVQQMAELHYYLAIQDIRNYRDPKLEVLYKVTPQVQAIATEMYATDPEAAIDFVSNYAYMNAVAWFEEWKLLGDRLLGQYALGYVNFRTTPFPDWWNELIGYGFPER